MVPAEEAVAKGLPTPHQETQSGRGSAKQVRERENEACIGGLRAPWRSIAALHTSQTTGALVKEALRKAVAEHPALLMAADGDKDFDPTDAAQMAGVERARHLVAEALGVVHPQPMGRSTSWQPHLVQAWVEAANDPDVDLAGWLRKGAPLGVREDLPSRGIFPEVDPGEANAALDDIFASMEPRANYKSYEEAFAHVTPELERLRKLGYVEVLGSWRQVQERFGRSVVVSKLAAILKPKADGSLRVRLVIDYRRSGVNAFVRTRERVVLPRIRDAIDNAVFLMSKAGGNKDMSWMVVDFKDAFHTVPVDPADLDLQVFMSSPGVFEVFNTTVFGSKASPLIWGRFGSFLMRSGQALFSLEELLLECYVDDPLMILAGAAETRRSNAALLLLWWRVLGPGLSWGKVQLGRSVEWIGVELNLPEDDEDLVEASLHEKFVQEFREEVVGMQSLPVVPADDLRRVAGKGSWAANVGPALKTFLQPLWKVLGDVDRQLKSPAQSARGKEAKRRRLKRGGVLVPTRRVRTALDWLVALLSQEEKTAIKRAVNWRTELSPPSLVITCDASPWGLGAVLSTPEGYPLAWLASTVTEEDARRLGITIGDCAAQAVLEALAILVAVRAWAPLWMKAKARVHVRSDSQAALGALAKVASPVVAMNAVAREVALDVAASSYGLEPMSWGHVSGALNHWADALSRLNAPEAKEVPAALATFEPTSVPARDAKWWRASSGPPATRKRHRRRR